MERHRRGAAHPYPRTARVNVLIRQVIATEIERIADGDERLRMLTVTGVDCAPDLRTATVYFASLPAEAVDALDDHGRALQVLLGREIHTKRTPRLTFAADPAVVAGEQIEAALRRVAVHEPGEDARAVKRSTGGPEGFLVLDKAAGRTSHDVVADVRRALHQRRVGHGGTLDPDATGVLVVAAGPATRLLRYVSDLDKAYRAEVVLGAATTTLDDSGEVTATAEMSAVTVTEVAAAARRLTGEIDQVPPMVSAIKVGGRRLHELAREGVEVPREPRRVTVSRFDVAPGAQPGVVVVEVECTSGTYVRSLADDLGRGLGGYAHLRNLVRTRVGPFTLAEAIPVDQVSAAALRPPRGLIAHIGAVEIAPALVEMVLHGRVLGRDELGGVGGGPWAVTAGGRLLAVYQAHTDGRVKPTLVYAAAPSAAPPGGTVGGDGSTRSQG